MSTALLTIYVLIWPALVLVVLGVISKGFFKDWATARRNGEDLVQLFTPPPTDFLSVAAVILRRTLGAAL